MKVRVTMTLDIDKDAWTLNYGVESTKAIREDIDTYVTNLVREQLNELGLLKEY